MRTRSRRPSRETPLEHNLLVTATLCLLAAGAVMVYSASSARNIIEGGGDGTRFLVRYAIYGALGFAAMQLIARQPLERIMRATGPLLLASFGLLLLTEVPGIGVSINGAQRWLGAGPLQFQPSELTKVLLVLHVAKVLAQSPRVVETPRLLVGVLWPAGLAVALVALQPDLGTALVISGTMSALLVCAGLRLRHLAVGYAAGAGLVLMYAATASYRWARLTTFLNPWDHAADAGYQSVQGQIALGSGGLFGVGLGQSVSKTNYLPEAHTDFILAIIGEELGVAGISGVLLLYGLLAYAGLRVAKGARGPYAQLVAAGVTSLVLVQGCLNVFTVLGLAPLTGVPLPFLSYGGTSLIVLLAAVGVLLNIAGGGTAHLRVVRAPSARGSRAHGASGSHRSRGDGRARGAGAGGRRRAS